MLLELLVRMALVVGSLILVGLVVVVGRERLLGLRQDWKRRLRAVAPALVLLVVILAVNNVTRTVGPDVSWVIGWEVTDAIYGVEGDFVVWLQSMATPAATTFFSYVYVYGYVFLLVFPLLAYVALRDVTPLRTTLFAYGFNYAIGLACYLVIIAYGPRNLLPDAVEPLLYSAFPEYQHLTRQVNRNTNVFPSLHTSLSVTVALIAYRTRAVYPRWTPVAWFLATSVAVSTMYLGIHWMLDVVAGVALAVISVELGARLAARRERDTQPAAVDVRERLTKAFR